GSSHRGQRRIPLYQRSYALDVDYHPVGNSRSALSQVRKKEARNMKVGMAQDLGYLKTLVDNLKEDAKESSSTLPMGVPKALETITRILQTLARDVDQAEYTAHAADSRMRRYGMR